jgi:hypothetical protein
MKDRRVATDTGKADGLAQREAFGVASSGNEDRIAVVGGVDAGLNRSGAVDEGSSRSALNGRGRHEEIDRDEGNSG